MKPKKTRGSNQGRFARILTALMDEREVGIREAAKLAGVGPSTVMSWRSGSSPSDYLAVKRLAQALGVSLSFLLTGEEEVLERGQIHLTEIFDGGQVLFDGYARVRIESLIPRKKLDDQVQE